ncbi:retention module-containing protein, partial [Pseudomonas sp. JQ170]|uniref:retention module-containing protein n=1 Tax=Pseudomonas sp. JQ170 TaxID=2828861 RepID=UPI002654F690
MSNVVAIVKSIVGQVIAVSPEGVRRVLIEGDRLFVGEQVLTGLAGAVTLELADGRTLDLGRDTQWSADAPDNSADLAAATAQAAPSVEELQQAIVAGLDPTTELEATAAGPTAAGSGAAGGGHSFVMLDATAGSVDPTIGFPTGPIGVAFDDNRLELGGLDDANNPNTTTPTRESGLTLTATPSITEAGGVIIYTATLGQPPLTDLTVTLSNGQVIVISAGQTTGSVSVTIPPNDTVYLDGSEISATITGTTGGGGLVVTPDTTPAVTQITDTIDTTTVTLTANPSVTEGGVITYTATLTNPAQTPVTVTLSNGTTITIGAGQTTGTVDVQTPPNDVYNNGSSVSTTITGATGGNFENLVPNPNPAVTTITDSIDNTGLSLTATGTVAEGGQIIYTATLTNPAGTPVTITLSNGAVITIAAGQTEGSVSVAAPGDDVYIDAGNVGVTIDKADGGNFENLVVSKEPAVTEVTDTLDTSTVTLTATPSVAEGGVVTYTASVSAPVTGSALVITLANGQQITIPVGQSTGSVEFVAPDNVHTTNPDLTNSITGTTGGNYEKLETTGNPVTTVTDGPDTDASTGLSLTATGNVDEGGQITYTATLTNPAGTAMTVTLSNGAVINIAAGATTGSVTVDAPTDDVYIDAGKVEVTIEGTDGGDFEKLAVDNTPAVTDVADTLDTSTVKLTADVGTVGEGGVFTYTATVSSPVTGSPLVINLTNGQTITIPVGQTTGTVQDTAPNNVHETNLDLTNSIESVTGGNYEKLEASGETTVTVTDGPGSEDTTGLKLTATDSVDEGGQITYTATLTNPAGTAMTVTLSNGAVINIAAGATTGSVTVDAPTDDVYIDAGKVEVTIEGTDGGDFEKLAVDSTPAVTDVADTLDTSTVKLTADVGTIGEGGVITYTATVSSPVTGSPLVINLTNGQTITIPVGQTTGTVQDTAPNNVHETNLDLTNSIESVTGGNYEKLEASGETTVTVTDGPGTDDTTGLKLTATETVDEGGEITYTATLTNPAGTAMTVTLSNGAVINIAAGATTGSVTVDAPTDDVYIDAGKVEVTIEGTDGGDFEKLAVDSTPAVTDVADTLDTSTVKLTADVGTVGEGGVITYTATVSSPVTGSPLVINLTNGQTITIPVGQTTGTVQDTAPNNVHETNLDLSNSIESFTGGNYENLITSGETNVTVTDGPDTDDTTGLKLTATETVEEGGEITYTATLTNPAGTAMTVTLSNGAVINIAAGATTGTVTVDAPTDDVYIDRDNVEVTIESTDGGDFEKLDIDPSAAVTDVTDTIDESTATLTADVTTIGEGGVITYTVTLSDPVKGAPLVINLANGQSITIPVNGTSGSVQFTTENNVHETNLDLSNSIESFTGGNYENLVTSGETNVTVTDGPDTDDTTGLKLTATETVDEGGEITYTATLTNPAGTAMTVTLSNGAVINIAAGATTGTVTVDAPTDDVYIDRDNVEVTIETTDGGDFEKLDIDPSAAVTDVTDTIDESTATLSADVTTIGEGGVITYTVTLSDPVKGAPLVINLANGQSITIPVNGTSGSVQFTTENNVHETNLDLSNSIESFTGGNYENLVTSGETNVTVTDGPDTDDTTGLKLTATEAVEEGGEITYTATLTNPAGTAMTVTLSNGAVINIAAGATTGTVTVDAPTDDVYIDRDNVEVTIESTDGGDFEKLDIDPSAAVTDVTDTIDESTATLTADVTTIGEGGVITYTVTLSDPVKGAPLVINLANGQSITIPVNGTSGSVQFTTENNVHETNLDLSNSIESFTGGNYENLVTSGETNVTVTDGPDTDDTTGLKLTATEAVEEGGEITYTATLTNPAGTAMTVTLSNGAVINIAAGATTGTVTVDAPTDDVYIDRDNVEVTIESTDGGDFEKLDIDPSAAVTDVTDTIDESTATLTADVTTIGEGGVITYTVTLSDPVKGAPLVINLANGQSITIPVNGTSGSVQFTTENNVHETNLDLSNSIESFTGGNYENLVTSGETSVTVTDGPDTDDTTGLKLTATETVEEGGEITYTATLTNPAGTAMTVTLSNGAVINIAAGATTGTVTVDAPTDDVYIDRDNVEVTIESTDGGDFEKLDIDPSAAVTDVTDTIDESTATLTADVTTIGEGGVITYTVTLSDPVKGAPLVINLANGQSITIPVNGTSGSVQFTTENNVHETNLDLSNSIESFTGGNYENLVTSGETNVTVTDGPDTDDTTGLKLTATETIEEGGEITYTATLTNPAGTAMTVTL